jgi:hypothetical protein
MKTTKKRISRPSGQNKISITTYIDPIHYAILENRAKNENTTMSYQLYQIVKDHFAHTTEDWKPNDNNNK